MWFKKHCVKNNDIAIIGMACRFAGANDYSGYWENLRNGINSISEISNDRWDLKEYYSIDFNEANKSSSKWAGLIDDIYGFDPEFFSISPREAIAMDPQQRLLLQEAYHCIEDAGISQQQLQEDKTSVFIGVMSTDYQERMAASGEIDSYACLGNYEGILANRVSHFFGLKGISKSIDTACSSSLVALHDARQSLLLGESDYVFAGGVNTICHPMKYIAFSKSKMLSPTGQCYTFDKAANGYVPGEGIAIILLTTLKNAVAKGHRIHAVIKGSAVNHSGKTASLTAPNVEAQREVIQNALCSAGITSEQISYVEAHGTGTSLGDPIEIEGLIRAFNTPKKQYCYIGSVKTNIGHCEAAAGLAGVIKTVLMMQHAELAPTLNVTHENPLINFQNSPFQLVKQLKPWNISHDQLRYAGVSSFGFGGVNAHVILQEGAAYQLDQNNNLQEDKNFPVIFSAASKDSLENMRSSWQRYIGSEQYQSQSLADISHTLLHGRDELNYRLSMQIHNKQEFENFIKQNNLSNKQHTSGKIHLIIGELTEVSYQWFQLLLKTYEPLNNSYMQCCELLVQVGGNKYLRQWSEESKSSNKSLNQFIVLYCIGKTLVDHARSLQTISGEGIGQLVSSVLSGWIELQEALLWLCKPKKGKDLNFKQPTFPIYDGYLESLLNPYVVKAEYIRDLYINTLQEGDESAALLNQLFEQAQQLEENQYTFKHYLKIWRDASERCHINWNYCFNKHSSYPSLLLIILSSCIKKLFLKWQLQETVLEQLPACMRLIQLIQDDLLSYEDVIILYTQLNEQRYQIINQHFNDNLNKKNCHAFYADYELYQEVINTNVAEWREQLCQIKLDNNSLDILLNYSNDAQIICLGHINLNNIQDPISINSIEENNFTRSLLSLWEKGFIDRLQLLIAKEAGKLVTLPNYQFIKERYLIAQPSHQNITSAKKHFETTLQKDSVFLKDHVINNKSILPAAVSLEIVRLASQLSFPDKYVLRLENIIWVQPIVADDRNQNIVIAVDFHHEQEKVAFEVVSHAEKVSDLLVNVQGYVILGQNKFDDVKFAPDIVDTIGLRCAEVIEHIELYNKLKVMGFNYGASFKTIKWLKIGKEEALSKLELTEINAADIDYVDYVLHPVLLDGALQTMVSLELATSTNSIPIPFSMEEIEIIAAIPNSCYVHVRRSSSNRQLLRYDAEIFGAEGEIYARIKGLTLRYTNISKEMPNLEFYHQDWESTATEEVRASGLNHLLVFAHNENIVNQLKLTEPARQIIQIYVGEQYQQISADHYIIIPGKKSDYEQLLNDLVLAYPKASWSHIVNAWSELYQDDSLHDINKYLAKNYFHLLALTQVLIAKKLTTIHLLHIYNYEENSLIIDEMNLGFVKTINKENPNYFYQLVGVNKEYQNPIALAEIIACEFNQKEQAHIRYDQESRLVSRLRQHNLADSRVLNNLKHGGIYLITGGLGGLGLIFAKYLAENYQAKLILVGRSALNINQQKLIDNITQLGAEVLYIAADVTLRSEVENLIKKAENKFGKLNGILHAAGYLSDAFIVKQTADDAQAIFAPKIHGIMYLDEYSKDNRELDYFISFSSIVSILGNVGQSAYASANAFLDQFSKYRNHLAAQGKRYGRSISINWPLWAEGRMGRDNETKQTLLAAFGIEQLTNEDGIEAFARILQSSATQIAPIYANQKIFQNLLSQSKKTYDPGNLEPLRQPAAEHLKNLIAAGLQLAPERLKADKAFEHYGIDSILAMSLTSILEKEYGPLPKTLFFEYQNLAALTEYFLLNHGNKRQQLEENKVETTEQFENYSANKVTDIAIIGMAGRYPMASNPNELWKNLKAAKDCVIEIPSERWDYHQYYNSDRKKPGISYSKWGGFIEDFDKFDPLFFNISPREAELMDPQERLFLEVAWQTLEDAGYNLQTCGTSIGVYVGVMYGQYQLYGVEETLKGNTSITNSFYSSIANRVSYYLNSHGPSMAVDTMCSSSLTSIHLACESIKRGECALALAGGVNISSHPNKYLLLSQGQFLSTDGKCRSFGEGGDGYVPGEGVGAVLLKPLSKALADRDHIYGVIKGSSINHGGKTNGYTVPNPVAQAELITTALKNADINPRTISYLEAHGTGTSLGDPIELRGLAKAFTEHTQANQFCAIGSVKSNLGHLESAAGIVAITKVLLQFQHQQLVPSLHSEIINSNCDFPQSPFYLQKELNNWDRPIIEEQNQKIVYPRRAGISSFGAGGSNAHVIIEEAPEPHPIADYKPYYLVTISAKTQEALKQRQRELLAWLIEVEEDINPYNKLITAASISYTLNYGREHFNYRSALIIQNLESLKQQLTLAVDDINSEYIYAGVLDETNLLEDNNALIHKLKTYQHPEKYYEDIKSLSEQYVKGSPINWQLFYAGEINYRISLPTYPFAKKRYWIRSTQAEDVPKLKPLTLKSINIPKELPMVATDTNMQDTQEIDKQLISIFKQVLFLEEEDININNNFSHYGVDSILGVEIVNKINKAFNLKLQATVIYNYPTIKSLSKHLTSALNNYTNIADVTEATAPIQAIGINPQPLIQASEKISLSNLSTLADKYSEPAVTQNLSKIVDEVAIVGVSIELPQVDSLSKFWEKLATGSDLVSEVPEKRWSVDGFYDPNPHARNKSISKWGGFITNADEFDPAFFKISPIEAEYMDPQQRLFLKHCCNALEDAGYSAASLSDSRCGVYVGVMNQDYNQLLLRNNQETIHYSVTGNAPSILAGRVAYYLNIKGPVVTIDTACSSSLVAMHLAIKTLLDGEADAMLAGGVTLWLAPSSYIGMSQSEMLSADGRCKTFDNKADGFVPGEGVGVVLLKRLSDAQRDGDHIYGVIKGSGVNQDGHTNGITAPNGIAQAQLEKEIYDRYQIDVENISYVETHGTGTKLGDPIEVSALIETFSQFTSNKQFCGLGSVKTNVGHTGAAAGIVGVIKTLLCLQHKKLVPSLHFATPNEHIQFNHSPFYVNTDLKEWKTLSDNKPRTAAISSFGFSGTNAHIVIEEYSELTRIKNSKPYYLITLSAKTAAAFKQKIKELHAWLKEYEHQEEVLESISYTLNLGRNHYEHRGSWVVNSNSSLQQELILSLEDKFSERGFKGIVVDNHKPDDDVIYQKVLKGTLDELQVWNNKDTQNYCDNLRVLANLYVKGYSIDWQLLHHGEAKKRISLPTYPFAKERYWIPSLKNTEERKKQFLRKEWFKNTPTESCSISSIIVVYDYQSEELALQLAKQQPNILLINIEDPINLSHEDLAVYEGLIDISRQELSKTQDNFIQLLQYYIQSRRAEVTKLLQVTQGIEPLKNTNTNLGGAEKVGLYRMLQNEHSWIASKHLDLDPKIIDQLELCKVILKELAIDSNETEICYRDNSRFYAQLKEYEPQYNLIGTKFAAQEVLLVTGGTKGIGLLCAKHCILKYGVKKIVLTGRESFPPKSEWNTLNLPQSLQDKIKNIQELESLGVQVEVLSLALNNREEVYNELNKITKSMGPISGIIHAAGFVDSETKAFVQKSIDTIDAVISPKIKGIKHLLEVVNKDALKFVILCSSVSAAIPSLASGYSDYAMANAYMDYYAIAHGTQLPIVSIQWPSWKETGLGEVTSHAYQKSGLLSITNEEGLTFLDQILKSLTYSVVMPIVVNSEQFNPEQLIRLKHVASNYSSPTITQPSSTIQQLMQDWLVNIFEQELKMTPGTLDKEKQFSDHGIDSIFLIQILRKINQALSLDLSISIFFENSSLVHLAEWLVLNYLAQVTELLEKQVSKEDIQIITSKSSSHINKDIAVIGMSCQFAGGESLDDYWDLLSQGQSAITPVPPDCWGINTKYYAGLINRIYEFDPDFFKIGKDDLQAMDPQAILLLKESLKAIYNAGYTHQEINGHKTGVYVGGRSHHQIGHTLLEKTRNPIMVLGQNYLAANISHFFNFHGPSLVIDTACSSALVGMNMAVEALQSNKIQTALVGGVSLLTSPFAHQIFERRNLLRGDGQFHILDQRASGIVLGEGAGMVYLKPLSLAEKDGDTIYAVISGISINNDGKTIGPAAPNIEAQKEVMKEALNQSECVAKDIQYIDVNGSGSELTDLLEIKAIEAIYREHATFPCYLGSMKPNIGHPLCAEGIASFIKVVLMLHHQKMVPFLSGHQPMKHYHLDPEKFKFAREFKNEELRYAALNSFADGGTNAHVILKHYKNNSRSIIHKPKTIPNMNLIDIRTFNLAEQEEA